MPPARKRTRSYDPVRVRTAVLAQFGHIRDTVGTLTAEQLALPTRLGDWTVRELAEHIALAFGSVAGALDHPEPAKADVTLLDWPFATAGCAADPEERARLAAGASPDLPALYGRTAETVGAALAGSSGERPVRTRSGGMRLADHLVTLAVELVVHTDDLAEATGLDLPYERQALAASVRLLADALAVKAPGGSVELRIPPYAVVQCVEGPRHTRGTPPNVVETDPLTWLRLATGREGWAAAREAARVSASGERSDLSALLPVMA
ncbi:maleylpyruvate isomerase family mycothiol-dependent enzyme [Streptomyces sp. PKU-MA01144]|uniref:maleylpyruvate isomerase family mycothiol-dependent enzyme n=1 Tax=Streptomyces TaxID=1883 RepID=UPI00148062D6|nr:MULTISPECIES: maleylpyruvate isomerase family mycothiol-dependent enzyme [Streptomyces]MCY0984714.1 sterol carrier family protein [Streptomyces tirandamycinicus]NNJ07731.1 maleylpyruvate isomerase family mycothiol-dependent enzyme [Streptomyces sp. PKU-MA01144]